MQKINREELQPHQPDPLSQIRAMGDSEWLIRKLIAEGVHNEESHNTIKRNVDHLDLMLGKDHIKDAGQDLTSLQEAATLGREFVAVEITEE